MTKIKTGLGALLFGAGAATVLLLGQAKPGEMTTRESIQWTMTAAEASLLLGGLATSMLGGVAVPAIEELSCRQVRVRTDTEEYDWRCSAHVQQVRPQSDLPGLKAAGKRYRILDIAPSE